MGTKGVFKIQSNIYDGPFLKKIVNLFSTLNYFCKKNSIADKLPGSKNTSGNYSLATVIG